MPASAGDIYASLVIVFISPSMKPIYKLRILLYLTVFPAVYSCNYSEKKSEPARTIKSEVIRLVKLKQTDFVITLENPISENKNIIYAPAFLYAWDKIKEDLKSPIIIDNSFSTDFYLLNKSISHRNSLHQNEYSVSSQIIDNTIIAKAIFNKTLPFERKLQVLVKPINFDKTQVAAFGMYYYDIDVINFTTILYYKDDNNFILKLAPKDKEHEIILVKGLNRYQTLKDAIKLTNKLIAKGKKEATDRRLLWKYEIVPKDKFAIPAIKFNIETNYRYLEGQSFSTGDNKKHSIELAYQRTGFILDENGAVVESEVVAVVDSAGVDPVIRHPKKMIFDKPFLIIVKRVDNINPYFVMKVANAELLTRE